MYLKIVRKMEGDSVDSDYPDYRVRISDIDEGASCAGPSACFRSACGQAPVV